MINNIGTRKEVMKREAKQTSGGLKIDDLMYNKYGKIVSKKMSNKSTEKYKLQYNNLLIGGVSNFDFDVFEEESKLEELEHQKKLKNAGRAINEVLKNNEESKLEELEVLEALPMDKQMKEREDINFNKYLSIDPFFSIQPQKLRRQNTNIHNNKYGNCYMFASFSLINNIKNNIEKDGDWININIEKDNNLMIILFFFYIIYYRFNKIQNKNLAYQPILSFTNFLNMLYELSNNIINFLPPRYIENIKELLGYNNNQLSNFFIDKKFLDINHIKEYIKSIKKNNLAVGLYRNNNILDDFITKISFLSKYKLYSINNIVSINNPKNNMNYNKYIEKNRIFININLFEESNNIDNILYKILQTNQFIQIGFHTTKSDMDEILKMAENIKMGKLISFRKQIIKTYKRRSLLNHNPNDLTGHIIVITDIITDAKRDPILINNNYVYRFKNNWGEKWYNEGYGYCTLESFNISEICFFIDNKNSVEIDTLINSILSNHSKKSLKRIVNNNSISNKRYKKRIKKETLNEKKETLNEKKETLNENKLDNEIKLLKNSFDNLSNNSKLPNNGLRNHGLSYLNDFLDNSNNE